MATYDQSIVFGKTSGHPGVLTDAAPMRVLDGPGTLLAFAGELLYSPATNDSIAANWTELAKGATAACPGPRTAVMRSDPSGGPCPFGFQFA